MADPDDSRDDLLRYCERMLGSRHDAEEAVQDVMLKVWNVMRRRDEARDTLPRALLFAAAKSRCFDVLRTRSRRPSTQPLSGGETSVTPCLPLDDALTSLPSLEREALLLTVIEGVDFRTAARLVGCSLGTLAKLRFQAVERMRKLLGGKEEL